MLNFLRSIVFWFTFSLSVIKLSVILPLLTRIWGGKSAWHYRVTAFFCRVILLLSGVRVDKKGAENLALVDKDQGLIIAANHGSFLDYFILQEVLSLPLIFAVWRAGFKVPLLRRVYRHLGYVGLGKREDNLRFSIMTARLIEGKGRLVIMSRPNYGNETKAEYGDSLISLSLSSKTPILPVAIKNASKVMPLGKWRLNSGRISVSIGKPAFFNSTAELQEEIGRLYSPHPA